MTFRRSLTAALAAAVLLTACASDDAPDTAVTTDPVTEQPADDETEPADSAEEDGAAADVDDDTTNDTVGDADDTNAAPDGEDPADDGGTDADDGADDAAAGGTRPAAVALTFDGQRVPIASACNGVDGAVLATTEGEVTISLVQEEGTALRYQGEGMTAETDQVEVEQVGGSTVYRATLASDEVPAVAVELELGDTSVLADC